MGVRLVIRVLLLLLVLAIAAGYATAWASRDACIDSTWQELEPQRLSSHPVGEIERPLSRSDIEARVVAPFRVEVSYLVPKGLESTVYARRYETLPWKHSLLSSEQHRINSAL